MALYNLGHVVGANGADGSPGAKGDKGDKGDTGATGNGIQKIELKSTSGKVKTYRITYTNGSYFDFQVTDGEDGSSATVEIVTSWNSTTSDEKVPSEKLSKTSLDAKAPTSHASTGTTYGLGTTSNYGHVKTVNGLTQASHSDGTALSAYQGKVLKTLIDAKSDFSGSYNDLTDKPTIPTKTSDLTNDGDGTNVFVKDDDSRLTNSRTPTSHTHGNISDDGKIATTGLPLYSTSQPVLADGRSGKNYKLERGMLPTTFIGNLSALSNIGTSANEGQGNINDAIDTAIGTINTSLSNKADSSHTHTKSQITDFPTIPSKISDLTNDSDFIETSSNSGVIANDGTVIEIGTTQGTVAAGNHTHSGYISGTKVISWSGSVSDSNIPSEKLVKNTLDDKISKSSTSGLVKNDGTIDTSTYLTQMKIGSTSGLPVKTGTNGVLTTGSFGTSAGTFAEGNHSHSGMLTSSDIADNLTTNDSTKVLSAKQGKALKDLIGDAITYINQ